MRTEWRSDERGIALILTMLLALTVAGMAIGIILMMGNSNLIAKFHANEAMMEAAADAGLEQGRDTLNGNPAIVPVGTGYATLENGASVRDANGAVIAGFTRSLYAGENGDTTGQYGNFASVISVIRNSRGAVVVRRLQLTQTSFSKFARFFNTWSCCSWGATEVVNGPVHSNQGMALQNAAPGATFNGPVTTVGSITNQAVGHWNGGVQTGVAAIQFPTTQTLTNLQAFATTGNTVVNGYGTATAFDPDTRIEFVAIDLNGDGDTADPNEGFFRVWKVSAGGVQQDKRNYVTARPWLNVPGGLPNVGGGAGAGTLAPTNTTDPNLYSPNCGGTPNTNGINTWTTAAAIMANLVLTTSQKVVTARNALVAADRRCYPGGDEALFGNQYIVADPSGNNYGSWQNWPGWGGVPPASLVLALSNPVGQIHPSTNATAVALTFWPLTRSFNVNFKGVIYVNGSVALSGLVRGRATVVATGNAILADDIIYVQPPNTNCADILGILTTNDAVIEKNSVNTPFNVKSNWTVAFDDTPNEIFQSFMLTLGNFQGEAIGGDPAVVAPENCAGKSRGCKSIIGGTIQQGVSGTFSGNSGWAEQDTWDACGLTNPPPYYPTTGRYVKNRYYEIDPVGFNVAAWFAANQ